MNDNGKPEETEEEKQKRKGLQRIAVWTGIPMTMLAGLILGYVVGSALEHRFPTNNILLSICVLVGVAAGFKLVFDYIKKLM